MYDSPGIYLYKEGRAMEIGGINKSDSFISWLMFQSSKTNSKPVPLAKVNWYFKGTSVNNSPGNGNVWSLTNDSCDKRIT